GCAGMAAYPLSSAPALLAPAGAVEIHSQTEIRLERNNFVTLKTNVVGKCKGFALLGIITMKPAKLSKALDRCYAQAAIHYGKPQTLVNVVMERNNAYWILFSIPEVSVRGDVVEFNPAAPSADESMEAVESERRRKSQAPPSGEATSPA